jgi:hypothetical protein
MFGYAAFAELPFATIGISVIPPVPPEILLGGHFGFDERDKRWEQEKKLEAQRKKKLHEAIFGLPPEIREEISTAPEQTIEIAARTTIDYDSLMQRVKDLERQIKVKRDDDDIAILLEFL